MLLTNANVVIQLVHNIYLSSTSSAWITAAKLRLVLLR